MYKCDPWLCSNVWFRDVSSDERITGESLANFSKTVVAGVDLLRGHEEFFFLRPNADTSYPVYVKNDDKTVRFRAMEKDEKYLLCVVVPGRRFEYDTETGW